MGFPKVMGKYLETFELVSWNVGFRSVGYGSSKTYELVIGM